MLETCPASPDPLGSWVVDKSGDISRDEPDICVVFDEDDDNFYGNWVCGFGFINVAFPKKTTRDLNAKEIKEYHGKVTMLGGGFGPVINVTGGNFRQYAVVTRQGDEKIHSGTLIAPVKVGGLIAMVTDDYADWHTSVIQSIRGKKVKTKNSVYEIQYI